MATTLQLFIYTIINVFHGTVEILAHYWFTIINVFSSKKVPPIKNPLLFESVVSLSRKIRTKQVSCVDVLEAFIERINDVNRTFNCVVAKRFEEARKEAEAADELLKSNSISEETLAKEKPLFGVPFTTKDAIAVKGLIQTAGLVCRKKHIAEEDADVISNLRAAGAYPIALTNVAELCMWWESSNLLHGRTNNPFNTNCTAGGSSGGEGCLQTLAGSAFGIGSDLGGSIRIPACFNGIFGHKPSKLIVSTNGYYPDTLPEHAAFNTIGPLCRRAEDLLPLLKIISGKKSHLLNLDEPVDIKKIDFFYQTDDGDSIAVSPVDDQIKALFKKINTYLETEHAIISKELSIEGFNKSTTIWATNMMQKNGPTFQEQLTDLKKPMNPFTELIKWSFWQSKHTFIAILCALLFELADKVGYKYGDETYTYYVDEKNKLAKELEELLGENGVFFYPTHPTAAPYHNESLARLMNTGFTGIFNILGFPATHIPMGLNNNGLPIGIQVISTVNNDRLCLAVAIELEKAFKGWIPPSGNA